MMKKIELKIQDLEERIAPSCSTTFVVDIGPAEAAMDNPNVNAVGGTQDLPEAAGNANDHSAVRDFC